MTPLFIGAEIYRLPVYRAPHPLAVPRAMLAHDLIRALGWLEEGQYRQSGIADAATLMRFHHRDYVAALQQAERDLALPDSLREKFRIGADSNPIHPAVFRRPATSVAGAILAAELTAVGGIVHAPGAGNHHGRPDRASGFCFVNDIAFLILRWRDLGIRRVVYVDLDAHHGDGVQDAFAHDPDVLTISVHEQGRWPRTGLAADRAGGAARNFPVPPGFNDSECDFLLANAILPLIEAHRPEAIVLLPGADALADDPMARLSLSNTAIWRAAAALRALAPRLVVLGGGGYNPYALARAWAGIWAVLNDLAVPDILPPGAEALLRATPYFRAAGRTPPAHWFTTLRDAPNTGQVRAEIAALAACALEE